MTAALSAPLSAFATTSAPTTPAPPPIPAPPAENPVRVGLGWALTGAELTAQGGLTVVAGGAVLGTVAPGQPAVVTLVSGKIQVNSLAPVSGPVRFLPAASATPNYVAYKGRTYRGEVEVLIAPSGNISVVNLINLEEYLQGVVPKEMSSGWPAEALKAQAVAARTYALANLGKWRNDGYDLRSNTDDQAYGGVAAEQSSTNQAVTGTKGQVITYGGRLVATYYFSSSGGYTENNENVWTGGSPVPYLRGVPDYDNVSGNAYFSWTYQFNPTEFAQKLTAAGYGVGSLTAVSPGALGPSGRPVLWTVAGSGGQKSLTMQQMRMSLGLPASARSIQPQLAGETAANSTATVAPAAAPVAVVGADGQVISRPVAGSYVLGVSGTAMQRPAGQAIGLGAAGVAVLGKTVQAPAPAPAPPQLAGFEVKGGGYGHGVGLSQWGAKGMALQGKSYTEILTHFYTGTKVETR